jgi:hypothetical protein
MHVVGKGNGLGQSDRLAAIAGKHRGIHQDATCVYPSGIYTGGGQNFCKNLQEHVASEPMFMICSWRQFTVLVMPEQLFLPGFERGSAIDFIFFALLLDAEHASRIVKLREYLCEENGLEGSRIAASLLHIRYMVLARMTVYREPSLNARSKLAQPYRPSHSMSCSIVQ